METNKIKEGLELIRGEAMRTKKHFRLFDIRYAHQADPMNVAIIDSGVLFSGEWVEIIETGKIQGPPSVFELSTNSIFISNQAIIHAETAIPYVKKGGGK